MLYACLVHDADGVHVEEVHADAAADAGTIALARRPGRLTTIIEEPVRHGFRPEPVAAPLRLRARADELARTVFVREARRRQDQHASAA